MKYDFQPSCRSFIQEFKKCAAYILMLSEFSNLYNLRSNFELIINLTLKSDHSCSSRFSAVDEILFAATLIPGVLSSKRTDGKIPRVPEKLGSNNCGILTSYVRDAKQSSRQKFIAHMVNCKRNFIKNLFVI